MAQLAELEHRLDQQLHAAAGMLPLIGDAVVKPTPGAAAQLSAAAERLRGDSRQVDYDLVRLMACQAPVASDLRLVLTMIEIAHHELLIANQFALIGEQVEEMTGTVAEVHATAEALRTMARLAEEQLAAAATAFVHRDAASAARLRDADDQLDLLNREICAASLRLERSAAERALALHHVLVARSLERIGDNAVRIAAQAALLAGARRSGAPAAA
jgi:phosphate transport system protein